MSAPSASPPPSPRTSPSRLSLYNISNAFIRIRRVREDRQIVSTSGPEPITHPCLSGAVSTQKVSVSREDQFLCASAVDVPKLLRACRSTLLDQARTIGANVLVEEQCVMTRCPVSILAHNRFSQVVHIHCPSEEPWGWSVQSPGQILGNNDVPTCFTNRPTRSNTLQMPLSQIGMTPGDPLPWISPRASRD